MTVRVHNYIEARRRLLKLKQVDLAEKSGVSQAMISKLEARQAWPSLNVLVSLADALECKPLELFVDPEAPSLDAMTAGLSEAKRATAERVVKAVVQSDDDD